MKIDCINLECPEPVIRTKKALEELGDEGFLEVVVNSLASKENVQRFVKSQGYDVKVEEDGDKSIISITKGFTCKVVESGSFKTIFLKSDKIGDGELGEKLIVGLLSSMVELDTPPKEIICVNKGVYLTTKNRQTIEIFKSLIKKGIKVYSCGICLDFYGLELEVGEIGNAYLTVESLMQSEGVISL